MRVLLLIRALDRGGAERQLVVLAQGLQQRGVEVHVAVWYSGGALQKDLNGTGVQVHDLRKKSRWDLLGFRGRVHRLMTDVNPDVLYSMLAGSNLLNAIARGGSQRTACVLGIRTGNILAENPPIIDRILHWVLLRLASRADGIIANSRVGLIPYQGLGIDPGFLHVVPNGIDTDRFQRCPDSGRAMRKKWGVDLNAPLVGVVATLSVAKDHGTFLRAAGHLARENSDVQFVLVGRDGQGMQDELSALAEECGISDRVYWPGVEDDMIGVYSALDVLCSSSVNEGFSNVIAEAMSCETPCVVTDAGDSAVIVGDLGEVVHPRDKVALANALRKTLQSPPSGTALRQRITREFSIERLVDATRQILSALHQ